MNIPSVEKLDIGGKRVVLRMDLDLSNLKSQMLDVKSVSESDLSRLSVELPTLKYILRGGPKGVVIIGHRGRPEGGVQSLTLRPVALALGELLGKEIGFVDEVVGSRTSEVVSRFGEGRVLMLENLRFDPREEKNDEGYVRELAGLGDVYVNEAFGVSHREHASIVGIPKLLPHAAGLRFVEEVERLGKVLDNPKKPVVVVLSGVKEDKLEYLEPFKRFADKILVGGRLPEYIEESRRQELGVSVIVAKLIQDKEDITVHSIEEFERVIGTAGTVVVAGPLGKSEEEGHRMGTERVFKAVAESDAYKLAGGGNTAEAIKLLGLEERFDWISVGGGAMLEYLAEGSLPGIEALVE